MRGSARLPGASALPGQQHLFGRGPERIDHLVGAPRGRARTQDDVADTRLAQRGDVASTWSGAPVGSGRVLLRGRGVSAHAGARLEAPRVDRPVRDTYERYVRPVTVAADAQRSLCSRRSVTSCGVSAGTVANAR
jgi:hypothetical protein